MRSKINFLITSLLAIISLLFLKSCKEETKAPIIIFETDTVKVDFKGVVQTVAYQIENPIDGAEIIIECNADWITDFNTETEGQISFKVAKNGIEGAREATVKVNYPAIDPAPEFTVMQEIGVEEFKIEVSNVTYTSTTVNIKPLDKDMKYLYFINFTSFLKDFSDDSLFAYDIANYQDEANDSGITVSELISNYTSSGDITEKQNNLYPGISYTIYVYGINVEEVERLTDITRFEVTTEAPPMIDAKFDIDPQVDGPSAYINYTPKNYDGYYYPIVYDGYDNSTTEAEFSEAVIRDWMSKCNLLRSYLHYSDEEILQNFCAKDACILTKDLATTTLYVALSAAVDDEMMMIRSKPSYKFFKTGEVSPSDNIITISVGDLKSISALITFTTTNNDPYAVKLALADDVEGLSDEDTIEYVIKNSETIHHGKYSETLTFLEPETEYVMFAVGCAAGKQTTQLFHLSFTTPEG